MIAYSPSQTTDYLTCPYLWYYRHRLRVRPPIADRDVSLIMGEAVAAGAATVHEALRDGRPVDPAEAAVAARAAAEKRQAHLLSLPGATVPVFLTDAWGRLPARAASASVWYAEHVRDAIPQEWQVLQVETPLGAGRADLIVRRDGLVFPVDLKVRGWLKREALQLGHEQARWRQTWQMLQYVSDLRGTITPDPGPPWLYAIIVYALAPTPFLNTYEYVVTDHALEQWRLGAARVWSLMREEALWRSPHHQTGYGPCPYARWCLDADGDPNQVYLHGFFYEEKHETHQPEAVEPRLD